MNLKIGGSNVGKIMYGGQEFGGATKLEPGTILYSAEADGSRDGRDALKNIHLLSTTKNWSNINGININMHSTNYGQLYADLNITGDDFKNLDIAKEYKIYDGKLTVSRSIVGGEYRLNISSDYFAYRLEIKAL